MSTLSRDTLWRIDAIQKHNMMAELNNKMWYEPASTKGLSAGFARRRCSIPEEIVGWRQRTESIIISLQLSFMRMLRRIGKSWKKPGLLEWSSGREASWGVLLRDKGLKRPEWGHTWLWSHVLRITVSPEAVRFWPRPIFKFQKVILFYFNYLGWLMGSRAKVAGYFVPDRSVGEPLVVARKCCL